MKTIRVMGLRRSGNHAIINWILANYNNGNSVDSVFNNNLHYRSLIFTNINKDIYFFNGCLDDPYRSIKNMINFEKTNLLLHSYEDQSFSYIINNSLNKYVHQEDDIVNIIVLRDPVNMCASRYKHVDHSVHTQVNEYYINLWISYAEEALNITNNMKNKIVILYNKWVTDKDYRNEIAKKMKMINYDNTQQVSICGGGSSFVGMNLDEPENYINRYKNVELPNDIIKLLNSDKVTNLVNKLF